MHKRVSKDEDGTVKGVEIVRMGSIELPALAVPHSSQGPLQLGDWLLIIEPVLSDLTATSEEWWRLLLREAEGWYQLHLSLPPLQRIQHDPVQPAVLSQERWTRLEKRVAALLLQAVPEVIRDELISARRMSVFGIVTYLMAVYCPGGVMEKQTLLRNLEEPSEIQNLAEAPGAIRKWLRWRRRTKEIGAVSPDPNLLLKGLNRLTRKILEANKELQFRVSLVRASLMVETTPTEQSVDQLAHHVLAEVDQLALTETSWSRWSSTKIRRKGKEKGRKEVRTTREGWSVDSSWQMEDAVKGKIAAGVTTLEMRSNAATIVEQWITWVLDAPDQEVHLAMEVQERLRSWRQKERTKQLELVIQKMRSQFPRIPLQWRIF